MDVLEAMILTDCRAVEEKGVHSCQVNLRSSPNSPHKRSHLEENISREDAYIPHASI
jgi:hypothetical protein